MNNVINFEQAQFRQQLRNDFPDAPTDTDRQCLALIQTGKFLHGLNSRERTALRKGLVDDRLFRSAEKKLVAIGRENDAMTQFVMALELLIKLSKG